MTNPQIITIEISAWDCGLHLRLSPQSMPKEMRLQGGLLLSCGIEIRGVVLEPETSQPRPIRIWLQPLVPEPERGVIEPDDCGRVLLNGGELQATLLLPQAAFQTSLSCLAATWRFLEIEASNGQEGEWVISAYSFSTTRRPTANEPSA